MLLAKAGSCASFEDFLARKVSKSPSIPKYGLASPFKGHFSTKSNVSKSPSIPKYGLASPFKGHFSTKSNAFSTGSSGRLTDQYRIRDHMVAHYSKILSAKAAVDCSVPKSVTTSIKYSDQQRRERLKKDIDRLEKILSLGTLSHPSSAQSSRSVSAVPKKNPYEADDKNMISPFIENRQLYSARSNYSSPEQCMDSPTAAREVRDSLRKSTNSSVSGLSIGLSSVKQICSATAFSFNGGNSKDDTFLHFQDQSTKTYSGDLLEKHKHHFKDTGQPFTPRTLKTEAKSVLSQYRYYTPPRRKRREDMIENGTQTEISFLRKPAAAVEKDATESQSEKHRTECAETSPTPDVEEKFDSFQVLKHRAEWNKLSSQQYSLASFDSMKYCKPRSLVMQKIQSEEEELQYLQFVADVTNEILTLGLFSNRVLERVFERHVEQNRHNLDENKMRHLLHVLREDLGCNSEGPDNDDNAEMLSFLHQEKPKAEPCSELTQPDGDMDLSSQDHEEKSDATHNLDVSDCTTEPDSDLENLDESTGMEHLERYFADSLSYCKNEGGCPLDLSGGPRANPSKTTLADCESENEHFFQ